MTTDGVTAYVVISFGAICLLVWALDRVNRRRG